MSATAVVLFGAGGHGRAVADAARRAGWQIVAVSDPALEAADGAARASWASWARPGTAAPLLLGDDGIAAALARRRGLGGLLGLGAAAGRDRVGSSLAAAGVALPPLVARTATVAPDASLGAATVVLEHAHVGPAARLGRACVVNTAAVVEHDVGLGDGTHCAPGAVLAGGVRCGGGVLVGAGAVVLPGRRLGDRATVAAGAVVVSDVVADATVRGVPATPGSEG